MGYGIVLPAITNIILGMLIIVLSIPLLKNKIGMNQWYGIRFAKSFESTENWYKINKFGAGRMVRWAIVIITIGIVSLFLPFHGSSILQILLVGCPPLLMIIPAIECWLYARKLPSDE